MERGDALALDRERLLERVDELASRVADLESELDRSHRLATLGTIAGSIAHEFNNILTPVMSYAQLALATPNDPELTAKALQKAVDGTEKAASIASSMLGFVRDDLGESSADVAEAVREALSCLARDPSKDGVRLSVQVPDGCRVQMKSVSLHQVLMNLILNAIEAIKPDGGSLTIVAERNEGCSTWNTSKGSGVRDQGSEKTGTDSRPRMMTNPGRAAAVGVVRIRVTDSGRGIPAELKERVFEPFFSRREQGAGGKKGTGLGLAICRRLVEEAGGRIAVESEVGVGTTFTIELPAASAKSANGSRAA